LKFSESSIIPEILSANFRSEKLIAHPKHHAKNAIAAFSSATNISMLWRKVQMIFESCLLNSWARTGIVEPQNLIIRANKGRLGAFV
jgi:hypothetical protein